MPRPPKDNLEPIGTARRPNASDLILRGLNGLPNPDPNVALRRKDFEAAQVALKAQVRLTQGENKVSFLRTRIGSGEASTEDESENVKENEDENVDDDVRVG